MAQSEGLRIQRLTLDAGERKAIRPPFQARAVFVGNATSADLKVLHSDEDDTQYLVITAGYEREIEMRTQRFSCDGDPAFWLKSTPGGTVILLWTL